MFDRDYTSKPRNYGNKSLGNVKGSDNQNHRLRNAMDILNELSDHLDKAQIRMNLDGTCNDMSSTGFTGGTVDCGYIYQKFSGPIVNYIMANSMGYIEPRQVWRWVRSQNPKLIESIAPELSDIFNNPDIPGQIGGGDVYSSEDWWNFALMCCCMFVLAKARTY